jgi:hypothetical protein
MHFEHFSALTMRLGNWKAAPHLQKLPQEKLTLIHSMQHLMCDSISLDAGANYGKNYRN